MDLIPPLAFWYGHMFAHECVRVHVRVRQVEGLPVIGAGSAATEKIKNAVSQACCVDVCVFGVLVGGGGCWLVSLDRRAPMRLASWYSRCVRTCVYLSCRRSARWRRAPTPCRPSR
jgi:hypothetical protein